MTREHPDAEDGELLSEAEALRRGAQLTVELLLEITGPSGADRVLGQLRRVREGLARPAALNAGEQVAWAGEQLLTGCARRSFPEWDPPAGPGA